MNPDIAVIKTRCSSPIGRALPDGYVNALTFGGHVNATWRTYYYDVAEMGHGDPILTDGSDVLCGAGLAIHSAKRCAGTEPIASAEIVAVQTGSAARAPQANIPYPRQDVRARYQVEIMLADGSPIEAVADELDDPDPNAYYWPAACDVSLDDGGSYGD